MKSAVVVFPGLNRDRDMIAALTAIGRHPQAIGGWKQNGDPLALYPLDEAAWLELAPDDLDMTDPENPVSVRPTAWREVHRWAGWAPKA